MRENVHPGAALRLPQATRYRASGAGLAHDPIRPLIQAVSKTCACQAKSRRNREIHKSRADPVTSAVLEAAPQ